MEKTFQQRVEESNRQATEAHIDYIIQQEMDAGRGYQLIVKVCNKVLADAPLAYEATEKERVCTYAAFLDYPSAKHYIAFASALVKYQDLWFAEKEKEDAEKETTKRQL